MLPPCPPCLGAALLIMTGGREKTLISRLMELRPLVFVGKVSYSLYLWHWPILVLAAHAKLERLKLGETLGLVGFALFAAVGTWKLVEQPFRGRSPIFSRRNVFGLAAAFIVAGVSFGAIGHLSNGWPSRYDPDVARIEAFEKDPSPMPVLCDVERPCALGGGNDVPRIVVWGDSHARALASAVGHVAARSGRLATLYSHINCLPVAGLIRRDWVACEAFNREVLSHLTKDSLPSVVVLHGRWSYVLQGEVEPRPTDAPREFTDSTGRRLNPNQQRSLLAERLRWTIDQLLSSGHSVILVGPVPEFADDVPATLAKRLAKGLVPLQYSRPVGAYESRHRHFLATLDALPHSSRLTIVRPEEAFCVNGECLSYVRDLPLYHDSNHLAEAGAQLLEPLIEAALPQLSLPPIRR